VPREERLSRSVIPIATTAPAFFAARQRASTAGLGTSTAFEFKRPKTRFCAASSQPAAPKIQAG
jgi:hypothetical protein